MNSENSKTSEQHVLTLNLTDKLDLRRGEQSVTLSNLIIFYTWKNIKSSYNSNKSKISAPTWNDKFELAGGSCSVSDIQDYPGTMKLLGSTENKTTKDKNGENLPHLEITEVALVHF